MALCNPERDNLRCGGNDVVLCLELGLTPTSSSKPLLTLIGGSECLKRAGIMRRLYKYANARSWYL